LIIDEAQNLSYELLEEIRLLSNMENGDEKLLNIFLVGQPEFNTILNEPRCRPLRQRIGISYHIRPLDENGTGEYVYKRLDLAGAKDSRKLFSKEVVKALHFYSNGYPRAINVLADNLMLLGYSRNTKKLTPEMVKECYLETKYEAPQYDIELVDRINDDIKSITISSGYWKWMAGIAAILIFILTIGGTVYFVRSQRVAVESDMKTLKEEVQLLKTGMEENHRQILEALKTKDIAVDEKNK
jgi:hypothetical protein